MKKTVLITGASHGIGRAVAYKFSEKNYNVVINYNSSESEAKSLEETITQRGGNAIAVRADISKADEVVAMFEQVGFMFGGVDVLINNAAVTSFSLMSDVSQDEWDNVFGVNVKGAFLCAKAAVPHMVRQKWGKIINISSIWGITGASCEVCYSTSKAALIGFTKALAKELAPSNINVNCVAPGMVDTKMNASFTDIELAQIIEEIPLGRIAQASEISEVVSFLASEKASYLTGQVISPNGGMVI